MADFYTVVTQRAICWYPRERNVLHRKGIMSCMCICHFHIYHYIMPWQENDKAIAFTVLGSQSPQQYNIQALFRAITSFVSIWRDLSLTVSRWAPIVLLLSQSPSRLQLLGQEARGTQPSVEHSPHPPTAIHSHKPQYTTHTCNNCTTVFPTGS